MEINKNHNPTSKGNLHNLLATRTPISKEDLSGLLHNLQDEKHPRLTIGMFFEFMKTAYQVNDSFESLATMLTTSSEIDWNKLAKINLNLDPINTESGNEHVNSSVTCSERIIDTTEENLTKDCLKSKLDCIQEKLDSFQETDNPRDNMDIKLNEQDSNPEKLNQMSESPTHIEESQIVKSTGSTENILTAMMRTNLSDILHEGLLDSVLPYMVPKPVVSLPIIKKSIANTEIRKSASLSCNVDARSNTSLAHKEKDRDKSKTSKKSMENEVEIHVCDEEKSIKKNFRCPQKLLIQKMCYFADVTAGQKLEEIDISVHCDVVIFDWLMRWVKKDIIKQSEWPILEAGNVIPLMVSASFLQMEPLLENCLQYCHDNMSDILKTSTILTCLGDNLLTRLIEYFTNEDVEILKDKRDKIQSKLFCKLIMILAEITPDNKKGHYSSLATLFKCSKCGKNIVQSVSDCVPCIPSAMKIDSNGAVHSKHVRDITWTLSGYIMTLRAELRSWRKVYWRLWGDCHFLFCTQCNIYFPIHQMDWCCYHPELPQFFINEQQRPMPFPLGRYPCCSQRAYRFEALVNQEGCRYREHIPHIRTQQDVNILNVFTVNREIIAMEPPQLFFPEKITRLVARDPSLQLGKLLCKEIMWWTGVELAPQRSRLGLLGKIWSGTGFRRLAQAQDSQKLLQKVRRQVSITTETSSRTSSITDSDEDDGVTYYEESSFDEESYYSDESNGCPIVKPSNKVKNKSKTQTVRRCWSNNLNVRHNQDNQRDFEERAATQMMTLLTKRVSAESSLILKSANKESWKRNQSAGGSYVKLEAEFRVQFNQSCKYKNSSGKSVRVKLNKV